MTPRDKIQFVLNDQLVTVDFKAFPELKPTTTLLNYLRTYQLLKGVKEGCAEGDCGACTVVIAENSYGKLTFKTIDSCLVFLPMIHGKQLITIENLSDSGTLHPIQQAMVDFNGSQCGYCTPGIVMSLFGLYKNHPNPSREIINDSLTGNLCRCTGYQPLIQAAEHVCSCVDNDKFKQHETKIIELLNKINSETDPITIATHQQNYYKPFSLTDALKLRKNHPSAHIVSGATDIALRQTKKQELLSEILDISDVKELNYFREEDHFYKIGSGLKLEQLKKHAEGKHPALNHILHYFGSLQIRNLATIGGNIGSASPIGDTLPVLIASKALVVLQSATSERTIPIEEFIKGYRSTDLRPDELITAIHIPLPEKNTIIRSYKVSKRKNMDISTVSACFALQLENGVIKESILAFGGMAGKSTRALVTESFLLNKNWNRSTIEQARNLLTHEFSPINDARSGVEYRNLVAGNLLLKFYTETLTAEL